MNRLIISIVAVFAVSPAFAADAKPEPGHITGRVVGPDGKPLPGAAVGYYDASRTTVTGADGRFKLGPIPPTAKPHRGVYANAEGLAREYVQAPPVLPGASSDLGDIVLLLGRRYNGRVTDDKGTPLPGVRVRCELLRKSNLGRPPTIVGPLALPLGKATPVAVAATEPGRLSGKVSERPVKWDGYLWVVAYSKNGYRSEARVGDDGTFHFPALPPGEYGLKVGHDLFTDEEIMAEEPQPPADPWKRAKLATVEPGKSTTVDSLTLPDR